MRKQLKRMVTSLVIAIGAMCADAATPAYNVLCINRTDGIVEHLQLHKDLRVGLSEEGNIRITHPQVTVEIPCADVKTFTVIESKSLTDVYDGDYSGIEETPATESRVSISPDAISVIGAGAIVLYDLNGNKVGSAPVVNGSATLGISSLTKGIYILKSGNLTLKISL